MQELQNGGVPPPESLVQQTTVPSHPHHPHSHKNMSGMSPSAASNNSAPPSSTNPKPKPTFRCDVCNYETSKSSHITIAQRQDDLTSNL